MIHIIYKDGEARVPPQKQYREQLTRGKITATTTGQYREHKNVDIKARSDYSSSPKRSKPSIMENIKHRSSKRTFFQKLKVSWKRANSKRL